MREQYLSQLKDHRPAIADFISRCERNHIAPEDRANMLRRVHSLAGSAEAHGYSAIGNAAKMFEDALIGQATNEVMLPLAHALFAACHEALVFLPSTTQVKAQSSARPAGTPAKKPRILVADDDRAVRAMIEAVLEHDAHVITAEDGLSALEAIRHHQPDLVLLDDIMPGMTGLRLLEKLREDPALRATRIIMLTSSDRPQDITRAANAGVIDYVLKPFDPQALAGKIRTMLLTGFAKSG